MRANIPRRMFLKLASSAAALPWLPRAAHAQSYPSRFVRLIVPFPPGGGGDALARPLAQRLSEVWGQQVIVENRGGAGGNVGAYQAANAPPDGYTLLLGAAYLSINPALYPTSGYSPFTDLAPISLLTIIPNVMMVSNSSPVHSVREFIDHAKANRGSVTFASTGIGASPHLSGELFKRMAGIEMTHVPYKGPAPAMQDVIGGQVDCGFLAGPTVLPHVRSGKLVALAVSGAQRSALLPEVPTVAEAGYPGFDATFSLVLFAPKGTPKPIVDAMAKALDGALRQPDVVERLRLSDQTVVAASPDDSATRLATDAKTWGAVVKRIGLQPD